MTIPHWQLMVSLDGKYWENICSLSTQILPVNLKSVARMVKHEYTHGCTQAKVKLREWPGTMRNLYRLGAVLKDIKLTHGTNNGHETIVVDPDIHKDQTRSFGIRAKEMAMDTTRRPTTAVVAPMTCDFRLPWA